MKRQIINNLFEFWEHIGTLTNTLYNDIAFKAVNHQESDWPNRVFSVDIDNIQRVIEQKTVKPLPQGITLDGIISIENHSNFEFVFSQVNMTLNMEGYILGENDDSIKRVINKNEAKLFAEVASKSFNYRVNATIISKLLDSDKVQLYLYKEKSKALGCGILFFDSSNNAGLHMIGTIKEVRGRGIGKKVTQCLLNEAKKKGKGHCVLHASKLGKPIYEKLGFKEEGEIKTYRIL